MVTQASLFVDAARIEAKRSPATRESNAAAALHQPEATVKHGDAFDLLPTLERASVDLLITSPPYWGLRTYGREHNIINIMREWLAASPSPKGEAIPDYSWYRDHGGILGSTMP